MTRRRSKWAIGVAAFSILGLCGARTATAHDGHSTDIETGDRPADVGSSQDAPPEGLTHSDWSSIRGEYERRRHAAVSVEGGFRARNPGQQWLTDFDGRGFTVEPNGADWRWGLELTSIGFPGHERAIGGHAAMSTQGDRVTYDWGGGLREWFVNDRRGLEHGFTLDVRPPRAGDAQVGAGDPQAGVGQWLELRLAVHGGLRPQGQPDGRGASFVENQGRTVIHYNGLKVWDADQRELPARLEADGAGLRLVIDERDARYPLTIDPTAQQAYLKASNTGAEDWFGHSVAVSGDTVVVGALFEASSATGVNGDQTDNSAGSSGAAYVFVRDGGGVWSQQAYLKASNTGVDDRFGYSVAVSGDTVVVGADRESSNATGVNGDQTNNSALFAGAAYVFVRDGFGVWSQQAYLKASNTDSFDIFGISVSVSGDTVVVGARDEDSNATGVNGDQTNNSAGFSGAAYVFIRDGFGVWSQQAYLKASNTNADDQFGFSVAVSGDTVVVGAYSEDSNATGVNGDQTNNSAAFSGAAYVFVRGGGVWSQQAYLKASNTEAFDYFGFSVAVSGDTVVVGARLEDSNATGVNGDQTNNSAVFAGAAYVFVRDGGGVWSQQAYLKASNTGVDDQFGSSVAVSGDTVVVGANLEDSSATGVNGDQTNNSLSASGAAYVFVRGGAVWSQQAYLKASNTDTGDVFGFSVAVSGDTVVVGAYSENSNATGVNGNQTNNSALNSGAAYVFFMSPCGNGTVDSGEECDDGNLVSGDCCSPACAFESTSTECRASAGVCDVAEFCDGAGNCPADAFQPNGTPCDDGFACTLTEACTGGMCVGGGDCDMNGNPDECDIANCVADPACDDCNLNGVPDSCDIANCTGDPECQDISPMDGVPDGCVTATGDPGCDPTQDWSCVDQWPPLPGGVPYPTNNPNNTFSVTLPPGTNLFLDVDAALDALTIDNGAGLRVTQAGPAGDLSLVSPGGLLLEGDLRVANNRSITASTGPVVIQDGGQYRRDPAAAPGSVSAALSSQRIDILPGGALRLEDSMSLTVTDDLRLECLTECDGLRGGQTPPILQSTTGQAYVQGNAVLTGTVTWGYSSSAPLELAGSFVNHCTSPEGFDFVHGAMLLNGTTEQRFEVAGDDLGAARTGFVHPMGLHSNFAMGTLDVAAGLGREVIFENDFGNIIGASPCDEALYVHHLILRAGSHIMLSNCKVYYETLTNEGATITTAGCGQLSAIPACTLDSECGDGSACYHDECVSGACQLTRVEYGDVDGSGGASPVDLDDILCVLDGFANFAVCFNGDLVPCMPDGGIDLDDILAVLDAFGGADPCNCPG